jgi:hypothetical protein
VSSLLRALLGIIVGWAIFAMSAIGLFRFTNQDPHVWPGWSFAIGSILYGMLFAAIAGFALAIIAREKANQAAIILAVLIALTALSSIAFVSKSGTPWSAISTAVFMAPMIYFGARFQRSKR